MILNQANLAILNMGYSAAFQMGLAASNPIWPRVAMDVPSNTAENAYAWLGQSTKFREWVGERVYQNLAQSDYRIKNKTWEDTVSVPREAVEDDQYGVYSKLMEQLGQDAANHPDELVFGLLKAGFSTMCHDGQYFFDADHPVGQQGSQVSVSNYQSGSGAPWFLLCTSKIVKPLIFQKRRPYAFQARTNLTDENVFKANEFVWGADARNNVGFGLWQTAFASKADLNEDNYSAAQAAMMNFKNDAGTPMGITPELLVVPPSLKTAAEKLVVATTVANGATNVLANSAKVLVVPWLA